MPRPAQSPLLQHSCAGEGDTHKDFRWGKWNGTAVTARSGQRTQCQTPPWTPVVLGAVYCQSGLAWVVTEGKSFQMSPCSSYQCPKAAQDRWAVAASREGGSSYHHEGVTNPEGVPAWRTWRDLNGLTVHSYHHGRSFTHNTSGHRESTRETCDGYKTYSCDVLRILTLKKGTELTCERLTY